MNGRSHLRFHLQVCGEGQYNRGDDAECEIAENNRQNPSERPWVARVALRSEPPHNDGGDQSCKSSDISAERGDLKRLSALRADQVIRISENFPGRNRTQTFRTHASRHTPPPKFGCKIHYPDRAEKPPAKSARIPRGAASGRCDRRARSRDRPGERFASHCCRESRDGAR
jgi:hypothetical protein